MKKLIFLLLAVPVIISAQSVEFRGKTVQAGFLIGKAENPKIILLNNDTLQSDADGNFFIGFDRDDTSSYTLIIKMDGGKAYIKKFNVRERKFKISRINNMNENYITPPQETINRIAEERKIMAAAREKIGEDESAYFSAGFIRPVKGGRRTGVFGSQRILNGIPKNIHGGLDIAAPEGTPIYAMTDGMVILTGNFYYNGNFVLLDHGQGLTSIYIHMSRILVNEGTFVKKGDIIGEIGTTGRSTGPHLHWGINWYNKRIDPQLILDIIE